MRGERSDTPSHRTTLASRRPIPRISLANGISRRALYQWHAVTQRGWETCARDTTPTYKDIARTNFIFITRP